MPTFGDLFTDVRGDDRTMRVSYHQDQGVVVVSLWLGPICRGSFRMAAGDVRKLMSTLTEIDLATAPAGTGDDSEAVLGAPERPQPAPEETGDISGTANRSALLPVIRVA